MTAATIPDPPRFVAHSPGFADVLGDHARLVQVVATDAHEGPVYVPGEDALYFTTPRPDVAIRRLRLDGERFPLEPERVETVRADADVDAANGMALARDGRLLVCDQGSHARPAAIVALDPATGRTETLVAGWHGLPLNSPNDVVVARDGMIWFSDPSYGFLQGFRPRPVLGDRVYRFDPRTGDLWTALQGLDKPNGLAFSPDERTLYVADNGAPHRLLAFDVAGGHRLVRRRVVAEFPPGHPDGVKVDRAGRIYASTPSGVRVLAPDGTPLGEIDLPGAVNFAFGGARRTVLFITTDTAIWAAVLDTQGA
jgi:gluconolactonase